MNTVTALLKGALEAYGAQAVLHRERDGGSQAVTALITPFVRRDRDARDKRTPLGEVDDGRFQFFGPPEATLAGVTLIECRGVRYDGLRARDWPLGNEPVYQWALLRKRGG